MSRSKQQKRRKKENYFDYTLLFLIIVLVGFGLVMLYSTSSYEAMEKFGDSLYYLKRQLRSTLIGFAFMAVFAAIDYHRWKKVSMLVYVISFLLCAIVLVPSIGIEYNGSRRWLGYGGLTFQPSEIAKITTILLFALLITKIVHHMKKMKALMILLIMTLPMVGVIAVSNLSTAIIILGIVVVMAFVASPKWSHFFAIGAVLGILGAAFIFLVDYRADRIEIWLHPEEYEKGYQTLQALYAIGSGGLFGKGLGESMQKLGYVPEAQNDMIFSIICEELGLFGAVCVMLLFLLMIWRFMVIANNARDLYGSMIVVGIMAHISLQVLLNVAVVTNTIPNTGIILPFISYGGTSVIFLLAEMGLALSVSRGIRFET
jgi:cell division protein FtsW